MRAILFRLNDDMIPDQYSAIGRGIGISAEEHEVTARTFMRNGYYRALGVTRNFDNAEEAFDFYNTAENSLTDHMMVGDVLIWENGQRELCCKIGWRDF